MYIRMINKTDITTVKTKRVKKTSENTELSKNTKAGLPVLLEPNIHDLYDELSRMDSFAYSRYNQ